MLTIVSLPVSIQNFVPVPAVGLQVRPLAYAPQLQRFVTAARQHIVSIRWQKQVDAEDGVRKSMLSTAEHLSW